MLDFAFNVVLFDHLMDDGLLRLDTSTTAADNGSIPQSQAREHARNEKTSNESCVSMSLALTE
jgi:hypothetical protein